MKLERVILRDFRQYFGEQQVRLPQHDQRNVILFHGVNGAGKTSFFAALNWCLYGAGTENIGQLISKEAVRRAEVGAEVVAKVTVWFNHDRQRYIASRQLRGIKQANGSVQELRGRDDDLVLMRTRYDGQSERIQNGTGMMNAILPSNVRTYFLFDGEKIEQFARPEHADEVKFAIKQVLNFEAIERAERHLDDVARDLRRELKRQATGELQRLVAQNDEARGRETDLLTRSSHFKHEISAAERHIGEVNGQLRELEGVQALQREYDLYTDQMEQRDRELQALTGRIRDLASGGYVALISNAITRAQALLDEKRQRGEIPSNIRQQFIQDLLDRQGCICGRPFSDHDAAHTHLVRLLETSVPSSLEDDVIRTSGSLPALLDRGTQLRSDLGDAMGNKVQLEEMLTSLYARRDDIKRQMGDSEHVEVSSLAQQREQFQVDLDNYRVEQGRAEMQLEQVRAEIADLERQIAVAQRSERREQALVRKVDLAQRAADAINAVYETFAENKRRQIEERTREIFHALAWKGEHFQDVRLSTDYQLDVIDRYGLPTRPELSAGERQVLSLSFIAGMAQVAEREAPIVMDTPFGRLSSAHRESITAHLPTLASQLVLFVTDEELRGQSLDNLTPHIAAEYRLHFDPATSCTTIEEMGQ